jgi:methionyl-tRNA synthetase
MPRIEEVTEDGTEDGTGYPVITGDYTGAARWESVPVRPGTPLQVPQPLFAKLDPGLADEELARLEKA